MTKYNLTALFKAFEPYRDEIKAEFKALAEATLARLTAYARNEDGVLRDKDLVRFSAHRDFVGAVRFLRPMVAHNPFCDRKKVVELDPERVEKAAERYAMNTVDALARKAWHKLGELDEAELLGVRRDEFTLVGKKDGHSVRLNQRRVGNVSKLGTPFYQWPARIKFDGKAISAAEYGRLMKGAK